MKIERLSEYFTIVVTIIVGVFLALHLGSSAGAGSNEGFLFIAAVVAVIIAIIMRANVWFLIPLSWPLANQISGIPGTPPLRSVMMVYAFGVFLVLKALKVVRTKNQYNWVDYLLFVNIAYLVVAYIRNPVGTESMGLDKIGGRPYFETVFFLCGYWVIGHVTITARQASRAPLFLILGDFYNAFMGKFVGSGEGEGFEMPAGGFDIGRETYLSGAGAQTARALYSLYSPITTLNPIHFWRFLFAALSILAVLKAGYRSLLSGIGFFFILSVYFRHGIWSVLRISFAILPFICIVLIAQGTMIELPNSIQRSLCFLPAKWNPNVVAEAENSTEWRHQIWDNVRKSGTKYINDWWFGDGFGMTRVQLRESSNSNDSQENLTLAGNYHSLPLSAIHVVGYVGFSLFCVFLFGVLIYAWKLIRLTKGTPFFALTLFIGLPVIINTVFDLLVTGFFEGSLLGNIYSVAMLRMISRSLEKYKQEMKESAIETNKPLPELAFHQFPLNHP